MVVEAGQGLVEQKHLGIERQGAGHLQALEHAERLRRRPGLGRGADPDPVQELPGAVALGPAVVLQQGGEGPPGAAVAGGQHDVLL